MVDRHWRAGNDVTPPGWSTVAAASPPGFTPHPPGQAGSESCRFSRGLGLSATQLSHDREQSAGSGLCYLLRSAVFLLRPSLLGAQRAERARRGGP